MERKSVALDHGGRVCEEAVYNAGSRAGGKHESIVVVGGQEFGTGQQVMHFGADSGSPSLIVRKVPFYS